MDKNVCAYYRTSSATNVGNDKDSKTRQQHSVKTYTQSKGLNVMNTAENIELTVDKSLTSMKLKDNGILTPNTWITRGKNNTIKLIKKFY